MKITNKWQPRRIEPSVATIDLQLILFLFIAGFFSRKINIFYYPQHIKIKILVSSNISSEKKLKISERKCIASEDEEKTTESVSGNVKMTKEDSSSSLDSDLDITSEKFDPLRALYAPEYRISEKQPKVIYQNLAAIESAFKRFGIMNLNKCNVTTKSTPKAAASGVSNDGANPSSSKRQLVIAEETQQRRFQPHQLPIKGSALRVKDMHNIYTYLDGVTGPMKVLKECMKEQRRVRVLVRHEHGIRGSLEGLLIFFDKFWNLWLRDVEEVWQRRKYKYGDNKICGEPQDCTWRLQELGIELPQQQVKSINRKTVEIKRHLPQLLVRGEHVALVFLLKKKRS